MKRKTKEFLKWFFRVDWSDMSNYFALALAALLLWWGLKTIIGAMFAPLTP